jgi:hypothetical protein
MNEDERPPATARRVVATLGADGRSGAAQGEAAATVFRFGGARGNVDPHTLTGASASADRSPPVAGEVVVTNLWQTSRDQPAGSDPASLPEGFDIECPPGGSRWRIVEMGPYRTAPTHATDTVDYDLVLEGAIDLLLDSGPVRLQAGDTAVLPAVPHGWQTHDAGCRIAVVQVAIDPGAD